MYTDIRHTSRDAYAAIRKEKKITQAETVLLCLEKHTKGLVRREIAGILNWFPSDVARSVNELVKSCEVVELSSRRKPSKMFVADNDVNEGYVVTISPKGRNRIKKLSKRVAAL